MKHFDLPQRLESREDYVVAVSRGRRVLHLGCADYPHTDERIADGSLLHAKIAAVASECLGVELQEVAVRALERHFGPASVVQGDVEHLEALQPRRFDVVIAGEIIEHLNNAGLFLASARLVLESDGQLLLTTTNAFCLRRLLRIPFGRESIHEEHTAYFSHSTLRNLVERFGYRLVDAASYRLPGLRPLIPCLAERLATLVSPNLGEGIIQLYRRA